MKRLAAFAREPGGADAIAPVVRSLAERGDVQLLLFAKEFATERFDAGGLRYELFPSNPPSLRDAVIERLERLRPHALLTSASSRPDDDMTEKLFWECGEAMKIPSLAVLDQWQNYAMRFSGPSPEQHLDCMPSCIAVMDAGVERDMVREGIDRDRILVSGHPRFDELNRFRDSWRNESSKSLRERLGIAPDRLVVTFISEPARRFWACEEGYNEVEVLDALLEQLERVTGDRGTKVAVVLKYHPRNIEEDFVELCFDRMKSSLELHVVRDEIDPWPLLSASDIVVGMISVLLLDAILLGKPTVSAQIGAASEGACIAVRSGAIPAITGADQLGVTLHSLVYDRPSRERYLRQQGSFFVRGGAVDCIISKLDEYLRRSSPIQIGEVSCE